MVTQKEEKERQKISRTETGKFFYDLSKATFSITVLGSLALMFNNSEIAHSLILGASAGLIMTASFFVIGYKVLNK